MAGNGLNSESPDCPLCLEPLGWDDINFYPCSCRYQICRFCWHRIRTDENGLCPHCREPYPENPAEYTPPSQEQLAKLKSEKRQKTVEKRQKLVDSRKNLASVRVVQKNLVFVIGLSPRLADPEVLKKNEYFGKYGRIYKVVINNHTVYNGAQGPSVSAYVTYYRSEDASKAIQAVNNAYIDGRYLKVSFGTTKYCTYFLRGTQCTKPDCMYLHALGDNEASFTKEDMQMGKHQVFESATLAATNPPAKEQAASRKQPLRTVVVSSATDTSESILPATASWASLSKVPGGTEPLPTQQPPFQVYSHSSSKESKSHTHSIGPHSTISGSNSFSNGPHSYSSEIESHTSNSVGDSHAYTRSHSLSSDSGSHTSNSVSHSSAIDEIHTHVSGGSNTRLNSGLHPTNTGSHSTNTGSRSTNSGLHPNTGSGSHSHISGGSHSHSTGTHAHSTSGTHSHSTSGSHSHSSSSKESSGSSKTHQLHSSTSSRYTHTQPQQHLHGHKTHSHSSGSHSHSSSSGSHSQHAHGSHSHVSYSKHSSHSHSSHGGSSGHTKYTHKSTDSSVHRSDSERERTSKSSRSSGLISPSSEPSKRHSSRDRDRVSEHRHSRGGSSSKSNTPSQSPKSSMSTSSSSGSLKQLQQDCASDSKPSGSGGGGEREGGGLKQAHSAEKLGSEGGSLVLESMEDWEEEGSVDSCVVGTADGRREDGVGGERVSAHTMPSGLRKAQEEEPNGTAVNVIPVLSAAGRGQFGALGVTWSTQAPNLTHPPPQPEDDLGFDPWDESNKGLADLLETEENASTMPRCIGKEKRDSTQQQQRQQQQKDASNGMPEQAQGREKLDAEDTISRQAEILPSSATVASWQEEFRSVFPNVNISFSDPWPSSKPRNDNKASSLHHAVEDTTGYNTTPLAPTLAYVYPQLAATSLSLNPSGAITSASQASFVEAKLHSEEGQGRSEWPDFSDNSVMSGTNGQQQQQQQPQQPQQPQQQQNSWTADGSITRDSSSTGNGPPLPPPGFTAKGKDSLGPNTLSNSVNHSFWANATGQVGHLYHNQLMQSWAHYMHLKAVPPQQLSRNQQQLLAQHQQYLARAQQALLMQGHPFLQATMGMQIRPGVVGMNMGHTAMHSGTPSVSLGHTARAINGGASGQVIPSTSSVSGQVTMTVPTSVAKHEMTDETVLNQPGSLYRIVEQNIRNKPDMSELPRTAKKSTLK